jgi:hypothetical protein
MFTYGHKMVFPYIIQTVSQILLKLDMRVFDEML